MKKKKTVKEKVTTKSVKKTNFLDSNWIVRITALVIIIPVVIVAILLLTSIEDSGEPVVGDRFDAHLTNKIEDAQLKSVEDALVYDNVDQVQVTLKSATLRILIDANDNVDAATIESIANDAYNKVIAILPVETYFTNLAGEEDTTIKMYDMEIHVYNLIPEEATTVEQIYAICYKNASSEQSGFDWVTTPRNQDVAESLLKENTNE